MRIGQHRQERVSLRDPKITGQTTGRKSSDPTHAAPQDRQPQRKIRRARIILENHVEKLAQCHKQCTASQYAETMKYKQERQIQPMGQVPQENIK